MPIFYKIARGEKSRSFFSSGKAPWPYGIDICFENVSHPIAFHEGFGQGQAWGVFSVREALEKQWEEHFKASNAAWLIEYVSQLAIGIPLPKDEIISKYQRLHNCLPTTYEVNENVFRT